MLKAIQDWCRVFNKPTNQHEQFLVETKEHIKMLNDLKYFTIDTQHQLELKHQFEKQRLDQLRLSTYSELFPQVHSGQEKLNELATQIMDHLQQIAELEKCIATLNKALQALPITAAELNKLLNSKYPSLAYYTRHYQIRFQSLVTDTPVEEEIKIAPQKENTFTQQILRKYPDLSAQQMYPDLSSDDKEYWLRLAK